MWIPNVVFPWWGLCPNAGGFFLVSNKGGAHSGSVKAKYCFLGSCKELVFLGASAWL